MTRSEIEERVQHAFANQGIDVQAWPWWVWIDSVIESEWAKAVKLTQEGTK